MSVCLHACPREFLRNYKSDFTIIIIMRLTYYRGSSHRLILAELCTSGFGDDVMFAHK